MSGFGWSLPPGCGTLPGEEDSGCCQVCGGLVDSDLCICHECPTCGGQGDPACYDDHGLVMSEEQGNQYDRLLKFYEEEAKAEAEYEESYLRYLNEEEGL